VRGAPSGFGGTRRFGKRSATLRDRFTAIGRPSLHTKCARASNELGLSRFTTDVLRVRIFVITSSKPPSGHARDPHTHARKLAQKMAYALNDEDVTDTTMAVAILVAAVITSFAESKDEATQLLNGIHGLSERFVRSCMDDKGGNLLH
jgi:hypothetical protein